ncbi:MAG TPA: hypothetical protein PLV72_00590 [Candidatus Magasanikbacteria bacterium]|nr:hypothetical protein [Candidatus Magasanikbacteria bacterium]
MSKTTSLIRNIYLYLATFVGLMMIAIPAAQLIRLSLQAWVFPLAAETQYQYNMPTAPYIGKVGTETDLGTIKLTTDEKQALEQWQTDYKIWQEKNKNTDWKKANMQQEASNQISILIVGVLIFTGHLLVLRSDKKKKEVE